MIESRRVRGPATLAAALRRWRLRRVNARLEPFGSASPRIGKVFAMSKAMQAAMSAGPGRIEEACGPFARRRGGVPEAAIAP